MNLLHDLGWVDLVLLGVAVLSVLVGLWRGVVFELLSLLGWLVAYVLANLLGPLVAGWLPGEPDHASWRLWGAYVAVFVVVLIGMALLARLMRALVAATPLSALDHLLGGAFGVLRAAVVLLIIGTVVALSPFVRSADWRQSHAQVWLGAGLDAVKPLLPEALISHLPA